MDSFFRPSLYKILVMSGFLFHHQIVFAGSYGDAGCGPGSILIKQNTLVSQTIAQSINATSTPFHTIALYSNLSNCDAKWASYPIEEKQKFQFIAENFEQIQSDIARGRGENLNAVLNLHGCQAQPSVPVLKIVKPLVENSFDAMFIANASRSLSQYCKVGG